MISTLSLTTAATNYLTVVYIMLMLLDLIILARINGRIASGFYDAALMRGATKWSYWSALYINDFLTLLVPAPILYLLNLSFGIYCPGAPFIWIQYALAQPLFLYTLYYFIIVAKEGKAWIPNAISIGILALSNLLLSTSLPFTILNTTAKQAVAMIMFRVNYFYPAGVFLATQSQIFQMFPIHLWTTDDKSTIADGTLWYGKYGAQYGIIAGFGLLFIYGLLFSLLLNGCCDKKYKQ